MIGHGDTGSQRSLRDLMCRVFAWVAAGVAISGVAAYLAADIPAFRTTPTLVVLILVQLGIVFLFAHSLMQFSVSVIRLLFIAYTISMGIILSSLFSLYTPLAIARAFFVAAGMFAAASIYGFYTDNDLSSKRSILMMGLWGIIFALIVNLFLQSTLVDTVISLVSVLLFSLLTAYDIQFIKQIAEFLVGQNEMVDAIAVRCALQLYLDLLNLFLSLLRLSDRQR